MEQLENLKFLDLSSNKIKTIPPEIGKLRSLWILLLHHNNIRSLLALIENLKSTIQILDLRNNPIDKEGNGKERTLGKKEIFKNKIKL